MDRDDLDSGSYDFSAHPFVLPTPPSSTTDEDYYAEVSLSTSSSLESPSPFYKGSISLPSGVPPVIIIASDSSSDESSIPYLPPKR